MDMYDFREDRIRDRVRFAFCSMGFSFTEYIRDRVRVRNRLRDRDRDRDKDRAPVGVRTQRRQGKRLVIATSNGLPVGVM